MRNEWIVIDIGCIECEAKSGIVGVFDSQHEAQILADECNAKFSIRDAKQHNFQCFQLPEINIIAHEYKNRH